MSSVAEVRSRRTLLSGLLGGAVALVASSLGRPAAALATDDNDVLNGFDNDVTQHRTLLHNTHANVTASSDDEFVDALFGFSENNGAGVAGQSTDGPGVKGYSGPIPMPDTLSQKVGVWGQSANGDGVAGHGLTGLRGVGAAEVGSGVIGSGGYGVQGTGDVVGVLGASTTGDGLRGQCALNGYALHTYGRVGLSGVSGIATIAANAKSVSLAPNGAVTATSFVLLTPAANIGKRSLWYSVNGSTHRLTINISSVYSTTKSLKVGWLILETS